MKLALVIAVVAALYAVAIGASVLIAQRRAPSSASRGCFVVELKDGTGAQVCPIGKIVHG